MINIKQLFMTTFNQFNQKLILEYNQSTNIQKAFLNSSIKLVSIDKSQKLIQFEYLDTEKSFIDNLKQIMDDNDWIPQSKEYFPDTKKKISNNSSCYHIFTSSDDEGTVIDFKNKTIEW